MKCAPQKAAPWTQTFSKTDGAIRVLAIERSLDA